MQYLLYFLAIVAIFYWIIDASVPDPRPEIKREYGVGILVLVVAFGGFGFVASLSTPMSHTNDSAYVVPSNSAPATAIVHAGKKSFIEVFDYNLHNGFVVGRIKNNAEFPYSSVIFAMDLYDGSGAKLGTTVGVVFGLGAGEERVFKVPANGENFSADRVKTAKLTEEISAQTYK